jgi:hypothetical protein
VGNAANITISDSYALGNVLADKTDSASSGNVHAGGLVGSFTTNGETIEHCFSAGTIRARSAGSGTIYAGGLVAQGGSGTIARNNAVLGASVTVQGSGTKQIGRVYGVAAGTTSNNHAVNTMLLFSDGVYNNPYPSTVSPTVNVAGKDGANVTDSDLRSQTFWTTTTLGFTAGASDWNFNSVYAKRHPALAGLGGQ